jgi:putative restriction endonuclease
VDSATDDAIRTAARAFVERHAVAAGGVVSWHDLVDFRFDGVRIPLVGQSGIRKPREFRAALTIRTAFRRDPGARPYFDELGPDGYQRYKWRGEDALHSDNQALRTAMEERKPLIWFYGIAPATYVPVADVLLLAEEPEQRQFVLGFTALMREQWDLVSSVLMSPPDLAIRREYAISTTRRRLHQPVFRQQVIRAYRSECAICNLRHMELLEAAHIREDAVGGEPVVSNGVSMCVLHHKAFDNDVIGIRPDHVVETRASVLGEVDGPTLRHALQGVHGTALRLPRRTDHHPNREYLEERYERFRAAS